MRTFELEPTYCEEEMRGVYTEAEIIEIAREENPNFIEEAPRDAMVKSIEYTEVDYAMLYLHYHDYASFYEIGVDI